MSSMKCIPRRVPLVSHSSVPCQASVAEKYSLPSNAVNSCGLELLIPGQMSLPCELPARTRVPGPQLVAVNAVVRGEEYPRARCCKLLDGCIPVAGSDLGHNGCSFVRPVCTEEFCSARLSYRPSRMP